MASLSKGTRPRRVRSALVRRRAPDSPGRGGPSQHRQLPVTGRPAIVNYASPTWPRRSRPIKATPVHGPAGGSTTVGLLRHVAHVFGIVDRTGFDEHERTGAAGTAPRRAPTTTTEAPTTTTEAPTTTTRRRRRRRRRRRPRRRPRRSGPTTTGRAATTTDPPVTDPTDHRHPRPRVVGGDSGGTLPATGWLTRRWRP